MKRLLPFAILLSTVSAASAVNLERQSHSITVEPGERAGQEQVCSDEQLISGGYEVNSVTGGPMAALVVTANTFASQSTWRVAFFNGHDAPLTVDFAITLFCD